VEKTGTFYLAKNRNFLLGVDISYNPARHGFTSPVDQSENTETHLEWASGCLAEAYRDDR